MLLNVVYVGYHHPGPYELHGLSRRVCAVQLLEEAVSISEERLQAQQEQIVACLDRLEDWTITTANHKTGMALLLMQSQWISLWPKADL